MESLLAIALLLAGPVLLVTGLVRRANSKEALEKFKAGPQLAPAKIADGRGFASPPTRIEGSKSIGIGAVLTLATLALCVLVVWAFTQLAGPLF